MIIKKLATLCVLATLGAFLGLMAMGYVSKVQADAYTDVIIEWNLMALSLPPGSTGRPDDMRHLAMVHAGMHDAINSIVGKYHVYAVKVAVPPSASPEAAAATAAHDILRRLFPGEAAAVDARLAASLASIPDGSSKTDGIAAGEAVGEAIFNLRAGDGHDVPLLYEFLEEPGQFRVPPHLPPDTQPFGTQWCCVPPFVLDRPSQLRSEGPPALDSEEWARDFNDVKNLGRVDSTARTADQTSLAYFWLEGSVVTWNRIARIAAADQDLDVVENARLFALLNLSLVDAFIASWDTKFHYNFWRPVTAIRAGDTDGNPKTEVEPSWEPLVPTPNHPDYNSGHAVFAGAGAEVLKRYFGTDNMSFGFRTTTSQDPGEEVRSYRSFSEAAQQCADSRVWNGFHTRSAVRHGLNQGKQVGHYVFNHAFQPVDRAKGRWEQSRPQIILRPLPAHLDSGDLSPGAFRIREVQRAADRQDDLRDMIQYWDQLKGDAARGSTSYYDEDENERAYDELRQSFTGIPRNDFPGNLAWRPFGSLLPDTEYYRNPDWNERQMRSPRK